MSFNTMSIIMNKRVRDLYFILLIGLVCSFSFANNSGTNTSEIQKGLNALENNKPDSALFYFWKASKNGMSKDSLYYFLTEIYIQKKVLDTALMLNYAINSNRNSDIKNQVLMQRHTIFVLLNLSKRADETLDSLWDNRIKTVKNFLPGIKCYSATGYHSDYEYKQIDYPWRKNMSTESEGKTISGMNYQFIITPCWHVPLKRSLSLLLSGKGVLHKNYAAVSGPFDKESYSYSGGVAIGIDGLFKKIQVIYEWERKRSYLQSMTSSNSINVFYSKFSRKTLLFANVLYGIDIGDNLYVNDQYVNVLGGLSKNIGNKSEINFNFGLSCLFMEALEFNDSIDIFQVVDFEKALKTDIPNSVYLEIDSNVIIGTVYNNIVQIMPNSQISISPRITIRRKFLQSFEFSLGLQWKNTRYFENYQWSDYGVDSNDINVPIPYKVTKEDDSDQYHFIIESFMEKTENGTDNFESFTEGSITRYSKKRIDNSLYADFSFSRRAGNMGVVEFVCVIGKNWSSLSSSLPSTIPNWDWHVSMNWRKQFSWTKKS